jgi:hypothetical protein
LCVDTGSANSDDLSSFRVTAWTAHPSFIPQICWLGVGEVDEPTYQFVGVPAIPQYLREMKTMGYKVLIHVRTVADFTRVGGTPPLPGSDDTGEGSQGGPSRSGPYLHSFPCVRGIPDTDVHNAWGRG